VPESLEDPGIPGKVALGQARHHAAGVGHGHCDPHLVADREVAPEPLVFVMEFGAR
jgi:hypothetical protein